MVPNLTYRKRTFFASPKAEAPPANGRVVFPAHRCSFARAGPVNRAAVRMYLKNDPEFARAVEEAEDERRGLIRSTI